jgi:hypothetical protein
MPIFLYGVGAVVVVIGAAMIGFGIPNNEFGIGNTLIVAGTTAFVGGLIVVALGIAVAQLQRLTDALATRPAVRSSRPFETFDPAVARPAAVAAVAAAAPARVPFPPKPRAETKAEVRPPEPRIDAPRAPALPNPDEPPVTVADEAFLSPQADPEVDTSAPERDEFIPPPQPAPRKPKTYFDAMWPAERKSPEAAKPAEPKLFEPKPFEPEPFENKPVEPAADEFAPPELRHAEEKRVEPKAPEFQWSDIRRGEPKVADAEADQEPEEEEAAPRTVAILKSGVVDGMGYTLYVDGSIEAELPQGTLRFASINELRSHLEKTS